MLPGSHIVAALNNWRNKTMLVLLLFGSSFDSRMVLGAMLEYRTRFGTVLQDNGL